MKRPLRPVDWVLRVPFGFLWFFVLMVLAVPVLIWMTVLYYAVHWTRAAGQRGPSGRDSSRSEAA